MTDRQILNKIKELSNGEFGQDIVIAGDAQIVLQRLMEIYILVSNHLSSNSYSEMTQPNQSELMKILTSLDKGEYLDKGGVDQALKELQSLIRTEKLKLLAEVRERVVGTKDLKLSDIYGNDWRNNYGYTEGQVRDAANHLQHKQLEALTKLEAEL